MALHEAVRTNDISRLRKLIATGADLDEKDELSRSALHLSAWFGNAVACKVLLDAGAKIKLTGQDGLTVMHFAVQSSTPNLEVIQLLHQTDKGLINMKNTKGYKTPLHLAVQKDNKIVVEELLKLGANKSALSNIKQKPIDLAKTEEMKNLLLAKGKIDNKSKGEQSSSLDEVTIVVGNLQKLTASLNN